MLSIPYRLLKSPVIETLFNDEKSFILKKQLNEPTLGKQSYIAKYVCSMVIKGRQELRTDNGSTIIIRAGEIGLIPRGIYTISDFLPEKGQFESYLFFIDKEIIDEFIQKDRSNIKATTDSDLLKLSLSPTLQLFVKSIQELSTIEGNAALMRLKLLELLFLLKTTHENINAFLSKVNIKSNSNIKNFLEQHYDKPLTVEDYAELTGRSVSSFRRDFKKYFDTTPQKWLIEKRMEKAYQLLSQQQESVTNIAYEVGYENISHFIRAFKAKYKITPKQFILKTAQKSIYH